MVNSSALASRVVELQTIYHHAMQEVFHWADIQVHTQKKKNVSFLKKEMHYFPEQRTFMLDGVNIPGKSNLPPRGVLAHFAGLSPIFVFACFFNG